MAKKNFGCMRDYLFRFVSNAAQDEFDAHVEDEELWCRSDSSNAETVVMSIYECVAQDLYDWANERGLLRE